MPEPNQPVDQSEVSSELPLNSESKMSLLQVVPFWPTGCTRDDPFEAGCVVVVLAGTDFVVVVLVVGGTDVVEVVEVVEVGNVSLGTVVVDEVTELVDRLCPRWLSGLRVLADAAPARLLTPRSATARGAASDLLDQIRKTLPRENFLACLLLAVVPRGIARSFVR